MKRLNSGAGGAHLGMFGRVIVFCNKEGAGSGGGGAGSGGEGGGEGAGAGGEGGGSGGGAGGEDVQTVVNRVLSAREKKNAATLAASIKEAVGAAVGETLQAQIKAALEAAGVKPQAAGSGGEGGQQQGAAQRSAEQDAELKKARTESAEAKQIAMEERRQREAYESRIQRDEERTALLAILNGGKDGRSLVRGEMLDDVAELLLKRVTRDPDNPSAILWKGDNWRDVKDADNSLNYEKLEAGVAKWAATPKGKAYAPPAGAAGGGTGRPHGSGVGRNRGDEPATDAEVASIIYRQRP